MNNAGQLLFTIFRAYVASLLSFRAEEQARALTK